MGRVISRGPQNLLNWNEELNRNPPWTPVRLTVPSISEPSPDNRSTANILHEDATAANTHYITRTFTQKYGEFYTVSAFMKAINRNWTLFQNIIDGPDANMYFDVATGALGAAPSAAILHAETLALPDDWYRVWCVYRSEGETDTIIRIYIAEADNDVTVDGLDQDSLYIWRPKVNEGWGPDPDFLTQEVARSGRY